MRRKLVGCLAAVILLAGAPYASAQNITGEIVGKVTDSSDAVLPGVTVTLVGPSLLQPMETTSSDAGTYRFALVPIGTYQVKFELGGFQAAQRDGIRISSGFTATINVALSVTGVQETVTVTSESPVVDLKKAGSTTTFTREVLEAIPSSRDPWVMMEQTPSIVMDRANVGGSQSGQQSGFVVRGAGTGNNVWSLDGVNVTDMSAVGATTMYYNFDSFEEMQYNIGGNDVTQATGGMGINLVTKSGSDKFRGSSRYLITDNKLQDDNVTDELRTQGASAGNPIQRVEDYGLEVGGPIFQRRMWFWGSIARNDVKVGVNGFFTGAPGCPTTRAEARNVDTDTLRSCLSTDQTLIKDYAFKFTGRPFADNRLDWYSDYADKFRNARDASALRPPETVVVQTGPVWTHKLNDQHVFTDRWLAEAQYAFVGGGFALDFPDPSTQFGIQRYFDEVTGEYRRSFSQSLFDRPLYLIDGKTTYFLPSTLGGDHAFKAGYSFRHAPVSSYTHIGGYVEARFRNGTPANATLFRDSFTEYIQDTHSFYIQDDFTRGRLSARIGLRFDRYADEALSSAVDPNPIAPALLPGVQFNGANSGVVWNNWSPRLAVNYDLTGAGKTVIGVNVSRYYGQPAVGDLSATLNPVTQVSLRYPWADLNNDQNVQFNEIQFVNPTTGVANAPVVTGNWTAATPGSPTTINTIDSNLKNETTDELLVSFQHELMPNVALQANYIWRKYDNFRWTTSEGVTSDIYQRVTERPDVAGDYPASAVLTCYSAPGVVGACPEITYYVPNVAIGGRKQTLTNRPDYNRGYNGFELSVTKRFSRKWYANLSYAYNSSVDNYDSSRAFTSTSPSTDPTNLDKLNGFQWAQESGGSGVSNVWVNAKWVLRATGMYNLPGNVMVSGFLNGRQGYILPYAVTTGNRVTASGVNTGAGTATVILEPYGDSRLPSFWQLDLKIERPFQFGKVRFRPQASIFNLANTNTVLGRDRALNATTYNSVLQILGPRVVQVGARVDF
jgi:hypothetical protein